jgi:hypothetical protein
MRATRLRLLMSVALVVLVSASVVAVSTAATVKPRLITIVVKNGRPVGGIKRPVIKKGTLVRIVVTTNAGSEIHLHGYDIEKKVVKGKPVVFQFVAKLAGRFELELHDPDALLAQLTVK